MTLPERVAAQRWYHTLELPGGVVTPGEYDLRTVAPRLPWPDLRGLRCLDVGSRDGFYAFEMEGRGAGEVVSLDLDDPDGIHFPGPRPPREAVQAELDAGNAAFSLAREALGSSVVRRHESVYALDAAGAGRFDLAVVGTLLLHLRDPVGALVALRGVADRLLVCDAVSFDPRRTPSARLAPDPAQPFWWLFNVAGLERAVTAAGWTIDSRAPRPFYVPWGPGRRMSLRAPLRQLPARALMKRGALHHWVVAS